MELRFGCYMDGSLEMEWRDEPVPGKHLFSHQKSQEGWVGRMGEERELELQFGQLVDRGELGRENLLFHVLTCTKLK